MGMERHEYKRWVLDVLDGREYDSYTSPDTSKERIAAEVVDLFLGPVWDPVTERNMTHG